MEIHTIQNKIYEIRGQRVMLDFDLAELYQVETRVLKQAVRRNIERFPEDFMLRLSTEEANRLIDIGRSQNAIPQDYNKTEFRPSEFPAAQNKRHLPQSSKLHHSFGEGLL